MSNAQTPTQPPAQAQTGQPSGVEFSGLYSGMIGASAGILGGALVAGLNFLLTRRRYLAEVEKISLEAEKLRRELGISVSKAVTSAFTASQESIVYSGSSGNTGYDFKFQPNFEWKNVDGKDVPQGEKGAGSVKHETGGTISIERSNTSGRATLTLHTYAIDGKQLDCIPRNDLLDSDRRFRISFEAKTVGASHTLRFVFKEESANGWLASSQQQILSQNWTNYSFFLQVPHTRSCRLRIDDIGVEAAPSSVQIRNLVVAQKTPLQLQ